MGERLRWAHFLALALVLFERTDAWSDDPCDMWEVCGGLFKGDWLASFEGEVADGVPDWEFDVSSRGNWALKRTIGWYVQRGEGRTPAELDRLIRAFDAADVAMCAALQEVPDAE
jgi:hypothetical protein